MHELAVTENILEIALRHAREAGAQRVTGLYLVLGRLSSIVDDSVQFYWDIVSKGTPAEGARLHFRRIAVELQCRSCGRRYAPEGEDMACQACGSTRIEILTGEEFCLEAIDVDAAETVGAARGAQA